MASKQKQVRFRLPDEGILSEANSQGVEDASLTSGDCDMLAEFLAFAADSEKVSGMKECHFVLDVAMVTGFAASNDISTSDRLVSLLHNLDRWQANKKFCVLVNTWIEKAAAKHLFPLPSLR